jgi:serine phosphatase RsbU (regulator of sigma subunit)
VKEKMMSKDATPKLLKVLLIEDSEMDALLLTEQLRAGGYDPQTQRVDNADDLQEALQRRSWDIIFSDHNMPQFSSTEALEIVRSSALDVPFIIVSGEIGEDVAVAAMKAGAQDYLMKGNLARLVAATARELHDAQERRARRAAERALLAQEEEFRLAREIQQRLFPAGPPELPEFDIAGASLPAAATGGDYFDFIQTRSGELYVVVGDVTGHGFGPALLMADVRAYLRALTVSDERFEDILARVRGLMIEDLGYDHFITLFFAKLEPTNGHWTYINAGHPPGYVISADGTVRDEMMPSTPALGIDRDELPLVARELTLKKGDLLLLISDGIPEARNRTGEEYGEERVLELVKKVRHKTSAEIIKALMDEARAFAHSKFEQDDMTAVVLKL